MGALQILHCTTALPDAIFRMGGSKLRRRSMGIFTEFFAKPRPLRAGRQSRGMLILNAMGSAELSDLGIKPADFPHIARDMASKRRF